MATTPYGPNSSSPQMGADEHGRDVFRLHQYLIGLRRRHPWLHTARTSPLQLANRQYVYQTRSGPDALVVALNIDDEPMSVSLPELGVKMARFSRGRGHRRRRSSPTRR